ncbi:MAG TPA: methylisocitrate lyase [Phycisphaerae bacterium]|nr:methylisocitrate lyase [Phycisphaerae bacterium]
MSGAGTESPGGRFRALAASERPLQIVGAVNAYCAMLAREAGHKAIYLSGAGVANASYGLPDLGMTSLENVLEDARRVVGACELPLLVDIDTGWGNALNIARAVREMERAGVAAVHLEDQEGGGGAKRCGHRPNKAIVSKGEMCDRVKAAVDGRRDDSFVIMARTDAAASEGVRGAVERSLAYVEAGADMIFAEALRSLEEFREFCGRVKVPVLANMTEFGKTPLLTKEELAGAGVAMVLYPLSAFRAMSKAALAVYEAIGRAGTQKDVVGLMQTREELYSVLDYHRYEEMVDRLNAKKAEET